MPAPAPDREEIKIQSQRSEAIEALQQYKTLNCDEKGKVRGANNMTKPEIEGMKELREKCKSEGWIVYSTDKSGRMVADTQQNYLRKLNEGQQDRRATPDEVKEAENECNNAMKQVIKVFGMGGEDTNKVKRFREAYTMGSGTVPPVIGLRKDHKGGEDPPLREVCQAREAPNSRLSTYLSGLLYRVAEQADEEQKTVLKSTEDTLRMVMDANEGIRETEEEWRRMEVRQEGRRMNPRRRCKRMEPGQDQELNMREQQETVLQWQERSVEVGSMDVKKLYPSITTDTAFSAVEMAVEESNIQFQGMDMREAGKLVRILGEEGEIERRGMDRYIMRRKTEGQGRPPTLGYLDKKENDNKWEPPQMQPNIGMKKKITAYMLALLVRLCIKNHFYQKGGVIYYQIEGLPIGLELAGAVAGVVMLIWDRMFLKRLGELGIPPIAYGRYVDDEDLVMRTIKKGVTYRRGELVMGEDTNEEGDVRTFRILREIGDEIMEDIKLTFETPSMCAEGKMPILDTRMWIERGKGWENEEGGETVDQVRFEFYRKPMCTPLTVLKRSAMGNKEKRQTCMMETYRRFKNTHPDLPVENRNHHVSTYMKSLQISGWSAEDRLEITTGAKKLYDGQLEKHRRGEQNLYRNKEEREKQKEGKLGGGRWFMKGGNLSLYKVPYTPKNELANKLREIMKKGAEGGGIRILVKPGPKILGLVSKPNPQADTCKELEVTPEGRLNSPWSPGPISRPSVNYRIDCLNCERGGETVTYFGETGLSCYGRALRHAETVRYSPDTSFMVKHNEEKHVGDPSHFRMAVTSSHFKARGRQVREGINISRVVTDKTLNSKREWLQPHLVSWRATVGLENDE